MTLSQNAAAEVWAVSTMSEKLVDHNHPPTDVSTVSDGLSFLSPTRYA